MTRRPTSVPGSPLLLDQVRDVEESIDFVMRPTGAQLVVTLAPWQLWYASRYPEYALLLAEADRTTIDGKWLQFCLRVAGMRYRLLTGRAIFDHVYRDPGSLRVAVIGGSPAATEAIRAARPEWYVYSGRVDSPVPDELARTLVEEIVEAGCDLVFLALGTPKQEQLGAQLSRRASVRVIGVGGATEVATGVKAAPNRVLVALKLEWLQRLLIDPRRFGPRVLQAATLLPRLLGEALLIRRRERSAMTDGSAS